MKYRKYKNLNIAYTYDDVTLHSRLNFYFHVCMYYSIQNIYLIKYLDLET